MCSASLDRRSTHKYEKRKNEVEEKPTKQVALTSKACNRDDIILSILKLIVSTENDITQLPNWLLNRAEFTHTE